MTEQELIHGISRAATDEGYSPAAVRELLVDHFRDIGFRLFAEKLEAAMQMLDEPKDFWEED